VSPADEARLSQLTTRWSLLVQAHQQTDRATARDAQAELLSRYGTAVFRYVQGLVRDPTVAKELCQEFAYRFVRGDFRDARAEKGRFRDYVKTALFHLVEEYWRKRKADDKTLPFDSRVFVPTPIPGLEHEFRMLWRQELINRTWAEFQRECDGGNRPTGYDVLRQKADDPVTPSAAHAKRLSDEYCRQFTPEYVRQMIHRARR
jgi:RNA polymerase sigma-70 factor (ECF subfamily)